MSGGSSGGSAAVVASGLCPAALGVDGGGIYDLPESNQQTDRCFFPELPKSVKLIFSTTSPQPLGLCQQAQCGCPLVCAAWWALSLRSAGHQALGMSIPFHTLA